MNNKFAENLKFLRDQKGIRQIDIAKILNTTQRRISYLEKGSIEPDLDTLIKIADFFDVSLDYLLGRKDY